MSTIDDYNKTITISRDGIRVGDNLIPGCIGRDIIVCQDILDHWTVVLTLLTGEPPVFEKGISRNDDGTVSIDEENQP